MMELRHVFAGYGSRDILTDLSLTLSPGSLTAILGPNGSGKTTLLRCLTGALPYRGSITLAGQEIRTLKPRQRAQAIGIMPQLLPGPGISVRELVSYGRQPHAGFLGRLSPRDWELTEQAMEAAGIADLADCSLPQLSGGQRQKAYFALLLAQDPRVLILDEPGAHLDGEAAGQLFRFLEDAKTRGRTVVTVLHDVNRALRIADRLVVLGGEPFVGTPPEFEASRIPQTRFGLRRIEGTDEDGKAVIFYR